MRGLSRDQYEAAIKRYPIIGDLYQMIQEFRGLMFTQESDKLDNWMKKAADLEMKGIDKYIRG